MTKVMTQLGFPTKYVMGATPKVFNAIVYKGAKTYKYDDAESLDKDI